MKTFYFYEIWCGYCASNENVFFFAVYVSDEFRSKVACENEIVQLTCNPYSRIAIYSASYGRTEYESIQCAQPQGVREESKCTFCVFGQFA